MRQGGGRQREGRRDAGLRLRAESVEDLDVVSASVQDALLAPVHCVYDRRRQTFTAPIDRYQWEAGRGFLGTGWRRAAAIQVASVLNARMRDVAQSDKEQYAVLLALRYEEAVEPPGGVLSLVLAGGGVIALEVDCLDLTLMDTGEPRRARGRPQHDLGNLT